MYVNDPVDLCWLPLKEFNLEGLENLLNETYIYSLSSNLRNEYKILNTFLQEIVNDLKSNYKHLLQANNFDLL